MLVCVDEEIDLGLVTWSQLESMFSHNEALRSKYGISNYKKNIFCQLFLDKEAIT